MVIHKAGRTRVPARPFACMHIIAALGAKARQNRPMLLSSFSETQTILYPNFAIQSRLKLNLSNDTPTSNLPTKSYPWRLCSFLSLTTPLNSIPPSWTSLTFALNPTISSLPATPLPFLLLLTTSSLRKFTTFFNFLSFFFFYFCFTHES